MWKHARIHWHQKRWSYKHQWPWLQWTRPKKKIPFPDEVGHSRAGYHASESAVMQLVSLTLTSPPLGKKQDQTKEDNSGQPNKVKAFYISASANNRLASPCHLSMEMWQGLLTPLCMGQGFVRVRSDGASHCHTLAFHCDIKRWYGGPACMHPYSESWHNVCGIDT